MRTPWRALSLIGVAVTAAVAAVIIDRSFHMPLRSPEPAGEVAGGPTERVERNGQPSGQGDGEDVVARALRLAAIDTTKKQQWVDDLPDLDLATLTSGQRETFLRIANGRRCGCGCGFTLAGCRRFDSECETSGPKAEALYDSVRSGRVSSAAGFRGRPAGH